MAEISKITLPTGTTYDIKDTVAREMASAGLAFVLSTDAASTPYGVTWDNGGTTVTGTLVASKKKKNKFYLVPQPTSVSKDIKAEYITIQDANDDYLWEKIGTTDIDLSSLGSLAYKDTATGNYTPEGTVSQPTFNGASLTSTGNFTPTGSVSTPTITVTPSTTSKYVATTATGGGSVTPGSAASATLPTFATSVSNETLVLSWTAGSFTANTPTSVTLPSFQSQTIVSGISSATSTQPSFTGTSGEVSVTGTPTGTVSQPTFSGTQKAVTVS